MRRGATAAGIAAVAIVGAVILVGRAEPPGAEPTRSEATASLAFTASGDIGSTPRSAATTEQIPRLGSDVHFALGDLSYGDPGDEGAWCEFVERRVGEGFPYELVAGNHESKGDDGSIDEFAACLPNRAPGLVGTYAREYYLDMPVDAPLVRFVMISPAIEFPDGIRSYGAGSDGYLWTLEAIEGARTEGIPWVVVGMHKPCLSVGNYGCDPGADLVDLLVSQRVDLVLSGHEHLYQRSVQLSLSAGCASTVPGGIDAACIADRDDDLGKGAGTVFITIGTGGTDLRDANADDPDAAYFAALAGANANPSWGNLVVRIDARRLVATFVPAVGSFTDGFRITSSPPPTQPAQ
ncbi:metallophosphoesterase [Agromyces sp. ZXT2-6]|uniref:metallophosphoesterase n=1 Tax=Agromyces sp. ZXT2-6 TaxID=3461153 RepID=UPI0040550A08